MFYSYLLQWSPLVLQMVFILCDILTATTLSYACGKFYLSLVRGTVFKNKQNQLQI